MSTLARVSSSHGMSSAEGVSSRVTPSASMVVTHEPALVAKAITRLVFAMGATAMDLPPEKDAELVEQLSQMVRMIITGARALANE